MKMQRSTQKALVRTVLLNIMLASVMFVGTKPLLAQEATGTSNAIVFTRQDAAFLKMIDQVAAPRTREAACLALAEQYEICSLAFPAISAGAYGFPMELAAKIAVTEVKQLITQTTSLKQILFVCFGESAYNAYTAAIQEIVCE